MIYLDHNATSPLRPAVVEAMGQAQVQLWGNPSSVHGPGRAARQGLDVARRQVAALVNVHESQVVFTSGGTESNNLALLGFAERAGFAGRVVVAAVEHPSVLSACQVLERRGVEVVRIPVDREGRVEAARVLAAVDGRTRLVSVMWANNETGVVQPVAALAEGCRGLGVPFHCDGVQAVGKVAVDASLPGLSALSISAHKFGGPKGVGALILSRESDPVPQIVGGGQERGRRSGTENLSGILGFGVAAGLAGAALADEGMRLAGLRDYLEATVQAELPGCVVFGQGAERLPNTTAFGVFGMDGETLVMNMDLAGFAVGAGSACSSGRARGSYVLEAMGVEPDLSRSLVRVSLGWDTQYSDVDRFASAFVRVVKRIWGMSGL